jgi:RNA polymerase sigma-70 factor (ECF subfamily)
MNETKYSLSALRSGERAEFARLVEDLSPAVYRLALNIVGEAQDAEDVLQETFIKVLHALPEFEGRSSLSTWIHRIAVNEALMLLRRRRPEALPVDSGEDGAEDEDAHMPVQLVDWCCLPEKEMLSAEARGKLDAAIQRLSPALRAVFLLRDVEGYSIAEAAQALGIGESAVKVRLMRARLRLRDELSGYYAGKMERTKP